MACFTVPLVGAAAAAAAKKCIDGRKARNPFAARLDSLCALGFGGCFLLAIEHVYHGEITFTPPFLTAMGEGPEAVDEMLREMSTRGVAMALLVTAVWAAGVAIEALVFRRAAKCAN